MRETDFDAFSSLLDDVASVLPPPTPLSSTGKAMFFRSVAHLGVEQVRSALDAHVRDPQRGRFFPKPADVLAQVDDGRPGADEAWAVAVRGQDESATIVWTDEMAQAWGIAKPVMQLGDEVGARVAFKDAYNRLSAESRAQGRAVQWTPSLGHDPESREAALTEAASLGRLLPNQVAGLLPPPVNSRMPEDIREALTAIRDRHARVQLADEEPSEDVLAKRETARLQAEANRRVVEHQAKHAATVARARFPTRERQA